MRILLIFLLVVFMKRLWANINVSPVGKSRMPGGVVSMPLNLCSVRISPPSLHVEGQGFKVGPNPICDLQVLRDVKPRISIDSGPAPQTPRR